MKHRAGSIRSTPTFYGEHTTPWSLSPSLSDKSAGHFITTLQQHSHATCELVSISMPALLRTRLSATATSQSLDGNSKFILSLQMIPCVESGVTFARLLPGTNSVDVKHCRFFQTLKVSQGMLALTSRLQAAIASCVTKDCALFVIRSINALPQFAGHGLTETGEFGDAAFSYWDRYSN